MPLDSTPTYNHQATVELVGCPAGFVDRVWHLVAPMIMRALKRDGNRTPIHQVYEQIKLEDKQLWLAVRDTEILAAGVTTILDYRNKRVLLFEYAGGKDIKRWAHLRFTLEEFAREKGCQEIEILGRKGFTRLFKDYTPTFIVMRKSL